MAAYIIGAVTVQDDSWVAEYIPNVKAQVEAHGGRYLAQAMDMEELEGDGSLPTVAVILEFPDKEKAKAWYSSSEYAPFLAARKAGSTGQLILMDGV